MPSLRAAASRASAITLSAALFVTLCVSAASTVEAQDSAAVLRLPPFEVHGFLELYYRSGDPTIKDGYRLRKADLKFNGLISPRLRWRVTFDGAKVLSLNTTSTAISDTAALNAASVDQKSRILQDAALTYTVNRYLSLDAGQQIVPLGYEGSVSTWFIETIERTNFIVERSRAVGLGDVRDVGVSANGAWANALEYHVGLFNEMGDSQGNTDTNDQKAVLGRLVYHVPMLTGFQVGSSAGFEGGPRTQEKQRFGTEAQFRTSQLTLRAETMAARDALLRRFGWYGLGEFRWTNALRFVARYDSWDRDRTAESSIANAFQREILGGVNYFIEGGNAKLALNIVRQTFPNIHTVPDATFGLLAFQALW